MATFVECGKFRILVDPGASVAGVRYHLPPHPLEKWRLQKHLERIHLYMRSSHIIIITCFHSDHCSHLFTDAYRNKLVFMQNPNVHLRAHRRKSAFHFINQIKGITKDTIYMDSRTFEMQDLRIVFSTPVQSNHKEKDDFVIPAALLYGSEVFLFSSNIEGLFQKSLVHWMIRQKPTFLYLDGPDTVSRNSAFEQDHLQKFFTLMEQLIIETPLKNIIFDHHITRDSKWHHKMEPLLKLAQARNIIVQTAAEYRGEENNLFEARRKILYQDEPVTPS